MSTYQEDTTESRQSDLAVMEAEEYKQKRRIKRILDAHDKVERLDDKSMEETVKSEISMDARNIMLLRAVKEFIRECYNLLLEYNENLAANDVDRYWMGDPQDPIGIVPMNREENVVIVGLKDVVHANTFYEEEWTEHEQRRHGPDEDVTKDEVHLFPTDLSWRAHLRLKEFLQQEYDLDLSFESNERDTDPNPI